jgi:hypothetical protein
MRKRMPWTIFLPLFVLLLVPTMINETKVTLILLPVGLMTVFIGNSPPGARLKNAIASVFLTTVFAAIFIPSYDYYIAQRKYGTPIMEFFTSEEKFDRYMGQSAALGTHDVKQVGRMDALTTPSREISRNATHFVFGLGIGNASRSSLGPDFTGQYFRDFGPFIQSAASLFILETGFLGLGIALIMNFLIFRDARVVSDLDSGLIGVIAAGWSGTAAVIGLATFYANIVGSEAISYMFWFFSGLIAAHRVRLSRGLA